MHKEMLKALNNPRYVHFVINPQTKSLLIVPCLETSEDALKIPYEKGKSCELFSISLIRSLTSLTPSVNFDRNYTIRGEIDEYAIIARFNINDITPTKRSISRKEDK